jgi:hypothetical protein
MRVGRLSNTTRSQQTIVKRRYIILKLLIKHKSEIIDSLIENYLMDNVIITAHLYSNKNFN